MGEMGQPEDPIPVQGATSALTLTSLQLGSFLFPSQFYFKISKHTGEVEEGNVTNYTI